MGFSLKASRVLGSGFPVSLLLGETLDCLIGLGQWFVERCRLIIEPELAIGLRVGPGTGFQLKQGLGLMLGRMLGWPGFACGDSGPVLAFDGPVDGGEVRFELAPPLHHGPRLPFGLGLPLSDCQLHKTAQQPPVERVREHGARSAHQIAAIRPGTMRDEAHAKRYERCPRCGGSLWYYAESPTYLADFARHGAPGQ
jgi:hypothetical protein